MPASGQRSVNPQVIIHTSMNEISTECLSMLEQANVSNTKVTVNPDRLGATVQVTRGSDQLAVSLELLNAAYVGMVRVWPLLKEAKTTVEAAQRKAKLDAAAQARRDKVEQKVRNAQERARLREERQRQAELDRIRARDEREAARAEEKATREAAAAEAKARADALTEAQRRAQVEADTRRATEAAKRLFRGSGERAVEAVRSSVKPKAPAARPAKAARKGGRK